MPHLLNTSTPRAAAARCPLPNMPGRKLLTRLLIRRPLSHLPAPQGAAHGVQGVRGLPLLPPHAGPERRAEACLPALRAPPLGAAGAAVHVAGAPQQVGTGGTVGTVSGASWLLIRGACMFSWPCACGCLLLRPLTTPGCASLCLLGTYHGRVLPCACLRSAKHHSMPMACTHRTHA